MMSGGSYHLQIGILRRGWQNLFAIREVLLRRASSRPRACLRQWGHHVGCHVIPALTLNYFVARKSGKESCFTFKMNK